MLRASWWEISPINCNIVFRTTMGAFSTPIFLQCRLIESYYNSNYILFIFFYYLLAIVSSQYVLVNMLQIELSVEAFCLFSRADGVNALTSCTIKLSVSFYLHAIMTLRWHMPIILILLNILISTDIPFNHFKFALNYLKFDILEYHYHNLRIMCDAEHWIFL